MAFYKNPATTDELRSPVKQRLTGAPRRPAAQMTSAELDRLIEELHLHKIELQQQNEYLEVARAQLEAALNQSSQLYDFSPVGDLLLDSSGVITKMNLAGANLLGGERTALLGNRFAAFVAGAQAPLLSAALARASASAEVQDVDAELKRPGLAALPVHIKLAALPQAAGWQLILVDASDRQRVEADLRTVSERWMLALDATGDGVWDWNVQTGAVIYSNRFEQLYGFSTRQYGQRLEDWIGRVHPQDKAPLQAALQAYLCGQTGSYSHECRGQCANGNWKWVLARGAIVSRSDDGKPLRMVGTHVDITGRKLTEESLREASQFQQAVFDSLIDQVAVLDKHGVVIQTNAAWRQYSMESGLADAPGLVSGEYLKTVDCISGHEQKTVEEIARGLASLAAGDTAQFQLPRPFFSPVDRRWFLMCARPVHDAQQRVVISHNDVTDLKAAEMQSWTLANIDTLTGALSRRNFLNLAEQELARARRYELPLMLLMLDLDHFKGVNDQYGHAAGDAVLQAFVKTVKAVLRESDLVGRLGGEEFAVLLPNTTMEGGRALALRIIESVHASAVDVAGAHIVYTVSIGAGCQRGEMTAADLLSQADAALYRAKGRGRDRLEVDSGPPGPTDPPAN